MSENARRRRRPVKKKKRRSPVIFVIIAILIIIFGLLFVSRFMSGDMRGSADGDVTVDIPSGSTVSEIADMLEQNGVVDSAFRFRTQCRVRGKGSEFKSGTYVFGSDETFDSLVDKLNTGAMDGEAIIVTFKEGQWLTEMAQTAVESGICTYDEFMTAADSRSYSYDFIKDIPERENTLEGYLYPETYYFDKNSTAETIVDSMLSQFEKVIKENQIKEKAEKLGYTLDDAVIIASLIEAEVKYEPERALVSSVIHNRLSQDIKLQIDASVIYSLGKRVTRVFYADLETADPHNTYYVNGLPSGPIGAPRAASLVAAVEPEKTDYLYYVVEDTKSGKHHFTGDYADFENANAEYKQQIDQEQ